MAIWLLDTRPLRPYSIIGTWLALPTLRTSMNRLLEPGTCHPDVGDTVLRRSLGPVKNKRASEPARSHDVAPFHGVSLVFFGLRATKLEC